jgi:hypothetical protein
METILSALRRDPLFAGGEDVGRDRLRLIVLVAIFAAVGTMVSIDIIDSIAALSSLPD